MTKSSDRREFLRLSAGFSVLGAGAPLAMQLAAAGPAAAATPGDYKAIVCIFLAGGQDSNNMVLATDDDSWGRYQQARAIGANGIALLKEGPIGAPPTGNSPADTPARWGGVLPIVPRTPQLIPPGTNASTRTFALHPKLLPLIPTFQANRLAVLANVGMLMQPTSKADYEGRRVELPQQLFSHNDQQSSWQAGAVEGAQTGWGGRIADMVRSYNTSTTFTAISAAGNAVFVAGDQIGQYVINTTGTPGVVVDALGSGNGLTDLQRTALRSIISNGGASKLTGDYTNVVTRSMASATTLNASIPGNIPAPTAFTNPVYGTGEPNPLATQLHAVAKLIAAASSLGVKRQVFFVQLGGFDTHADQNKNEPNNLAKLAHAMSYFDGVLGDLNGADVRNRVTTFTASDFSRTFTTNGGGTDHSWGGHHFIMGGAVNGGDMFGQYPTLGVDRGSFRNPDMTENNMIPTSSVDQYGATLGKWFGVSDSDLLTVFPRLSRFNPDKRNLGFMQA